MWEAGRMIAARPGDISWIRSRAASIAWALTISFSIKIHHQDPLTPMEETLRALEDLVAQRLVRYIGCSNWLAWQIAMALGIFRVSRLGEIRHGSSLLFDRRAATSSGRSFQ